jgi:hypothetical protein
MNTYLVKLKVCSEVHEIETLARDAQVAVNQAKSELVNTVSYAREFNVRTLDVRKLW